VLEQYSLALDWGKEPWAGVSPRYLTKGYREGSCVVDNSEVGWASREAERLDMDPAQFMCYISDGASFGTRS